MLMGDVIIDPDIVPDPYIRGIKEAFELFRHACTLHDSAHMLELTSPNDTKKKMMYLMAFKELTRKRDEIIEKAIQKYSQTKELKTNELQPIAKDNSKSETVIG